MIGRRFLFKNASKNAESFNLLNDRNVSLLNTTFGLGLQPTGGFSSPIATSTARRIQFSLDDEC